jgi:hypothetical protein
MTPRNFSSCFFDDTRTPAHVKPVSRKWNTLKTMGLAMGLALCSAPPAQTADADSARSGGIWKAVVPPKPMKGEFDSLDPIGVAAGARIKADCSLNWISPDDGKLYCFSSGTSLEFFLDKPQANLERARRNWLRMAAQAEENSKDRRRLGGVAATRP